jgi:translation initiation factor 2B subunit (eIF-2B alpha/beta/delta family)
MAAATRAALRLTRLLGQTPQALGRRGQSLLDEQATVVTLGYSTAVHAALVQGKERVMHVTTLESGHENGRLVHELEEEGPPAHTLPLADVDDALKAAQVVLLGCSAFLADGSIVAEAGALELVQKAAAKKIPVHFFADTLKLAPWLPPSKTSDRKSPLWELVPPVYVDHVITEDGIRRPNQLLQAAADLAPRWRALEPSSKPYRGGQSL